MTLQPGDLFEWIDQNTNRPVRKLERLFSTTMGCWIPIGGRFLLISIFAHTLTWLHPTHGVCSAEIENTFALGRTLPIRPIRCD